MIDMKKIGLKPREMQVMRAAVWSLETVKGGRYLVSDNQRKAAERLIERGFLTKEKTTFSPPVDWLVVRLTKRNWAALETAVA